MPDIIAATTDGRLGKVAFSSSTWADARDASTASILNVTDTNGDPFAVAAENSTARGGVQVVFRYFLAFDTSGVTGTVSSATITLTSDVTSAAATEIGDIILVKASKPDLSNNIAAADFDAINGFSTGNTMSGNVIDYSSEFTSMSNTDGATNVITLNSNALTDIENLNVFALVVVNFDYDYSNTQPSSGTRAYNGLYFADTTTNTAYKPKLTYTLATAGAEVAKVDGVAEANILKVIGVANANIAKVNGVDMP